MDPLYTQVELMIIIIATLAQALSGHGPAVSIIGVLVFWRCVAHMVASWINPLTDASSSL